MNKRILAAIMSAIVVMSAFSGCSVKEEKENKTDNGTMVDVQNEDIMATDVEYEKIYEDYLERKIRESEPDAGDFSKGMFLCDLNEDGVPELFSIDWDDHAVRFHQFKDGEMIEPKYKDGEFYVDGDSVILERSYFTNPRDFMGVYRNRETGKTALISSVMTTENQQRFDIITYDGNELSVRDAEKEGKSRKEIMRNYEFVEGSVHGSYLMRGTYQMYQLDTAKATLKEHIEEFENAERPSYSKAGDGEGDYYLNDVQMSKNEIVIAPVAEITLEQYQKAINSENDNTVEINGETYGVRFDEGAYANNGSVILYDMAGNEMYFEEPTEDYPVSKINGLSGEPVTAKITDDTRLVTAASSEEEEKAVEEFFNNFEDEYNGSYFRITIKNNEVVEMYLTYRP